MKVAVSLAAFLQSLDQRWFEALRHAEGRLARHRRLISRSADGYCYVLVGVVIALSPIGGWDFTSHTLSAFGLERTLYWVIKNALRRKRPPQALPGCKSDIMAADEFSFPSGHSSAAFLFATLVFLHCWPLGLMLYPWAVAVALSRIYLGVHFPLDTLCGALLGLGVAVAMGAFLF